MKSSLLKRFAYTFLIFINLSICAQYIPPRIPAEQVRQAEERNKLLARNIYSKTDWFYVIKEGVLTSENFKVLVTKYNKTGSVRELVKVNKKGQDILYTIPEYNANSLIDSMTDFDPSGQVLERLAFHYNKNRFLKEIVRYNNYEYIISKIKYEYDSATHAMTEVFYFSPDSITQRNVYTYSDFFTGQLTHLIHYIGPDRLVYKMKVYWEDDRRLKDEYYNEIEELEFYFEYHYNPDGTLEEVERIFPDGRKMKKYIYHYNEQDLLVGSVEYNLQGQMIAYYKFTYE